MGRAMIHQHKQKNPTKREHLHFKTARKPSSNAILVTEKRSLFFIVSSDVIAKIDFLTTLLLFKI